MAKSSGVVILMIGFLARDRNDRQSASSASAMSSVTSCVA